LSVAVKTVYPPHLLALTEGPNIPLDKPIVLIGRHQECDIQIPSRKISRRHCCLAQVEDHMVVRDLGSTNGVRINGVKVVEGSLQPGDELMIGNFRYQLKWGDESEQTLAASVKHAIMPQKSMPMHKVAAEESCEIPVALPDASYSQAIPQGKPLVAPALPAKPDKGKANENGSGSQKHIPFLS
jgi:predicted component of type VI protein secretion system